MTQPLALARLWVLMATVFIDMIGFLMVLPLLPFYAERLGASPSTIGLMVSAFSVAQVAAAPLWGRLSDRWGRRPVLIAGLVASAAAYLLFAGAGSIAILFLSRIVQGAGGGTTGVAQAYVTDTVVAEERAKALGWLSAATSAGVMIGPALGSFTTRFGSWVPGVIAAVLCIVNAAFAGRFLPESRPEHAKHETRRPLGTAMLEVMRRPTLPASILIWIYAIGMMAFMAMNGVLALFLQRRFGIDEKTIGWFYVYVGSISLVMRSVILGPTVRWLGEVAIMRLGTVALVLGLAVIPFSQSIWAFGLAILLVPIGTALLFPATTALVSRHASSADTGQTMGVQQAFGGIARMAGPAWAGAAFQHLGIGSPFWLAAATMSAVGVLAWRIEPQARRGAKQPEPAAG